MKNVKNILAALALFASLIALTASNAAAQRAGSWVDIGRGFANAGASAKGPLQFAHSKSSNKNGIGFGHGFAVGAGPQGIAISNSIGAGGGPLGAAHNMQINIGRNGTHVSHGGVISEGGNRRVISGGQTGTQNGQVYGGSQSTGFGNNTRAYSKSHTRQFYSPAPAVYPAVQSNYTQGNYTQGGYSSTAAPMNAPIQSFRSNAPVSRVIFGR